MKLKERTDLYGGAEYEEKEVVETECRGEYGRLFLGVHGSVQDPVEDDHYAHHRHTAQQRHEEGRAPSGRES